MWLNLNCVISVLDGAVLDWIALLMGRLWLVTHVRHYRKLLNQMEEESERIPEMATRW